MTTSRSRTALAAAGAFTLLALAGCSDDAPSVAPPSSSAAAPSETGTSGSDGGSTSAPAVPSPTEAPSSSAPTEPSTSATSSSAPRESSAGGGGQTAKYVLPPSKVADEIDTQLTQKNLAPESVTCREGLPARVGAKAHCTATVKGTRHPLLATVSRVDMANKKVFFIINRDPSAAS